MRALAVTPGRPGTAALDEREVPEAAGPLVVADVVAVGVCGTDREIVAGGYGEAPPGRQRLVIGHEAVVRVAGTDRLLVPFVRHPDPLPCEMCAAGAWDMCRNGRFTEHGIKGLDGFAADQVVLDPGHAVEVDGGWGDVAALVEPASVVAKAWEHIEAVGRRAPWRPRRVLVTGAGPIGLLAALLGVQRGLEVHVLDRVTTGPKPELVRDLGATYHASGVDEAGEDADVVLECTGADAVVLEVVRRTAPGAVVCLTGVSTGGRKVPVDVGALNRSLVLENDVVFGSVNANRGHYEEAVAALGRASPPWLERLVSRRVPLDAWEAAFQPAPDDVKVLLLPGSR